MENEMDKVKKFLKMPKEFKLKNEEGDELNLFIAPLEIQHFPDLMGVVNEIQVKKTLAGLSNENLSKLTSLLRWSLKEGGNKLPDNIIDKLIISQFSNIFTEFVTLNDLGGGSPTSTDELDRKLGKIKEGMKKNESS